MSMRFPMNTESWDIFRDQLNYRLIVITKDLPLKITTIYDGFDDHMPRDLHRMVMKPYKDYDAYMNNLWC